MSVEPLRAVETKPRNISFDEFWSAYPRRQAKKDAMKAWAQIPANQHEQILRAVPVHCRSKQWQDGYIPLPATWLRGERWTDEIEFKVEAVIVRDMHAPDPQCNGLRGTERCKNLATLYVDKKRGYCRECAP